MEGLRYRFTGKQIKGQINLASRGFTFAIAVPGKILGVALVGLGLRGVLDEDTIESLRGDQSFFIPSQEHHARVTSITVYTPRSMLSN